MTLMSWVRMPSIAQIPAIGPVGVDSCLMLLQRDLDPFRLLTCWRGMHDGLRMDNRSVVCSHYHSRSYVIKTLGDDPEMCAQTWMRKKEKENK